MKFYLFLTLTIMQVIWEKNNTSETQVEKTRYPEMSDYGNKFKVSEFKI